ncbi:trimeric intracellular cation channel family protein [Sulfurovum sp. TSL1]|uniref:trimeric intracellular cation channel family protein n=1 Tax=Sulfurovum sp. TSL1 TaxID=2826994 RepID=UPI001CC5ACEF|nr:TRIC cation channel family protein [Sulfurovum sp. TSL1]GIT97346.1 membrane protein [Sulfurovum sp. TSL1]
MFEIAEYIGIIAFASSGFFVATRNQLDFLGTLISVFLTALGGGIIRDVVVDKMPYTFTHNIPALTILIVMILLIVFRFNTRDSIENKSFFILSDSIGLISFSITGALIAIEAGLNLTGVLALAFVTAVGGGIIRDVIINEIPFVLKTGFYGTIALLIGLTLYVLDLYELISYYTMIMVFIAGIVLRLVAYYKKWAIPMI